MLRAKVVWPFIKWQWQKKIVGKWVNILFLNIINSALFAVDVRKKQYKY